MSAKVVTVTSGKGGVGKTTATANLGTALADSGQKVVCIDADIGLRNLDVVMGLENRIVYDLVDVVEQQGQEHDPAVMIREHPNVMAFFEFRGVGKRLRVLGRHDSVVPTREKPRGLRIESMCNASGLDCPHQR